MQVAIVDNGQVVEIGHYKTLFSNVSFPSTGPSDEWLTAHDAMRVSLSKQYDKNTQKLVSVDPYVEDGWVYTVSVTDLADAEIQAKQEAETERKSKQMRDQRNRLLEETDFYALTDVTMTDAMKAYRQELRDITDHENFPDLVPNEFDEGGNKVSGDWPVKP